VRHDPRVSEETTQRSRRAPAVPDHPPGDPSPGRLAAVAVAALALGAAILLVAGELATLFDVRAISVVVKTVKTGPHHAYAQALIAAAAMVMALVHLRTGRRAPLLALAALGAISLLIGIVHDLPDTHAAGVVGDRFEDAKASPRAGLWLELGGGVLLFLAAGAGLLLAPARRAR
jgi:hypothetical protein